MKVTPPRVKTTASEMDWQFAFCERIRRLGFSARNDRTVTTPDGVRTRPDVLVCDLQETILANVEVKAPEEFRTACQREAARRQALADSQRLDTPIFGWTDGATLHMEERVSKKRRVSVLAPSTDLPDDTPEDDIALRIGFTRSSIARFPALLRERVYRTASVTDVGRADAIDLTAFVNGVHDLAIIVGEADCGKTTYLGQLAGRPEWDAMPLDAASFADRSPERVLQDYIGLLTGQYDVAPWGLVDGLVRQRKARGTPPVAFVIDSLDEWQGALNDICARLSVLLDEAGRRSIKVVLASRPARARQVLQHPLLRNRAVTTSTVLMFSEQEREEARRRYFEAYGITGDLRGRALALSASPGMMAAIAEAYEGEARVDEHLTRRKLFDRYRRKKILRIVSRVEHASEIDVDRAVDIVARRMLAADDPALRVDVALDSGVTGTIIDQLVSESMLVDVGDERPSRRRLRFRFGRFRDDALAESTFEGPDSAEAVESYWDNGVGRSAIEYAAPESDEVRRAAYARARVDAPANFFSTLDVIDGWDLLAAECESGPLPDDIARRLPYMVNKPVVARPPLLKAALRADPRMTLMWLMQVGVDVADATTWATIAEAPEAHDELTFRALLGVAAGLMRRGIVDRTEVMEVFDIALARLREGRRGDSPEFWSLAKEFLRSASTSGEARALLRRILPADALCFGTGHTGDAVLPRHYAGLVHSRDVEECIRLVSSRCSPRAWLAFAFATLLKACCERFGPTYRGTDVTGTGRSGSGYADNAWVLDACVPAFRELLKTQPAKAIAKRIERLPAFSRLHPSFRARALLLAAPIEALVEATAGLDDLRTRRGSLPTLGDLIDARAAEAPAIAAQSLAADLKRYGNPTSPEQARELHRQIADGDEDAYIVALHVVSQADFWRVDWLGVEFFKDIAWSEARPSRALELVRTAVEAGYPIDRLIDHESVRKILIAAIDAGDDLASLRSQPGVSDALSYLLPGTRRFPELAAGFYESSSRTGKRDLLMRADALPKERAAAMLRLAFVDLSASDEGTPDKETDTSAPVHGDLADAAYNALVMSLQRHGAAFFDDLGIDVVYTVEAAASGRRAWAGLLATEWALQAGRDRPPTVRRVLRAWTDIVERFDDAALHEEVARLLRKYWPLLDQAQRDWYRERLWNTANGLVAVIGLSLADDATSSDKELAVANIQAASVKVVGVVANRLWRELHDGRLTLSRQLRDVVDVLVERTVEPDTAASLTRVAKVLASTHHDEALLLIWRLVRKSIDDDLALWDASLDGAIDLSKLSLDEVRAAVAALAPADVTANRLGALQIVCEALAARDDDDRAAVRECFLSLSRWDYACQCYRQWQRRALD